MSTFNYKNIQINYEVYGSGNVVVLLHGFLENMAMWSDITPVLAKKNKVIAIDLLGHGKTGSLGYIHTMEDQARMVNELLQHLKLRKFQFIGHSMGGYVALAFADLFPTKTKSVSLMNSTAYPDTEEKQINRDRAIEAVKKSHETFIKVSIPMLFSAENRERLPEEINQVIQEALKTPKQGIIAALEGMKIREDRTILLQRGTFKKLLILGKSDPVLEYQATIKQAENTDTEIVEFQNGHMSHIEDFESLLETFKSFVS